MIQTYINSTLTCSGDHVNSLSAADTTHSSNADEGKTADAGTAADTDKGVSTAEKEHAAEKSEAKTQTKNETDTDVTMVHAFRANVVTRFLSNDGFVSHLTPVRLRKDSEGMSIGISVHNTYVYFC